MIESRTEEVTGEGRDTEIIIREEEEEEESIREQRETNEHQRQDVQRDAFKK